MGRLLRERTLLRQWGNIDSAPAGADTAAAVGKYWEGSCGSGHCCGSGEIYIVLLREQTLLRQWGNNGKAPAGAGTAAAVGENRKRSYWSRHCCSSGENTGSAHGGAVTTAVVRKYR